MGSYRNHAPLHGKEQGQDIFGHGVLGESVA
jgi:hypothetical protein